MALIATVLYKHSHKHSHKHGKMTDIIKLIVCILLDNCIVIINELSHLFIQANALRMCLFFGFIGIPKGQFYAHVQPLAT